MWHSLDGRKKNTRGSSFEDAREDFGVDDFESLKFWGHEKPQLLQAGVEIVKIDLLRGQNAQEFTLFATLP